MIKIKHTFIKTLPKFAQELPVFTYAVEIDGKKYGGYIQQGKEVREFTILRYLVHHKRRTIEQVLGIPYDLYRCLKNNLND